MRISHPQEANNDMAFRDRKMRDQIKLKILLQTIPITQEIAGFFDPMFPKGPSEGQCFSSVGLNLAKLGDLGEIPALGGRW